MRCKNEEKKEGIENGGLDYGICHGSDKYTNSDVGKCGEETEVKSQQCRDQGGKESKAPGQKCRRQKGQMVQYQEKDCHGQQ